MLTISLEDMRFYGGHGMYPEEGVLGNTFVVDVSVGIPDNGTVADLSGTVDYEKVYGIVSEVMGNPASMLETLAGQCADRIRREFPSSCAIEIRIAKLNPPVGGEVGRSRVSLKRRFDGD